MEPERNEGPRGRRRRGARSTVRLDARSLWARLALLSRIRNGRGIGDGVLAPAWAASLLRPGPTPSCSRRERRWRPRSPVWRLPASLGRLLGPSSRLFNQHKKLRYSWAVDLDATSGDSRKRDSGN